MISQILLLAGESRIVTPAFAVTGLFILAVLTGLMLVLIVREKVKDRTRQAPPPPANFLRQAPPLPEKRRSGKPPGLPRQH
jgi:hypothetical protein